MEFQGHAVLKSVASWRPSKLVPIFRPPLSSPMVHTDNDREFDHAYVEPGKPPGSTMRFKLKRVQWGEPQPGKARRVARGY